MRASLRRLWTSRRLVRPTARGWQAILFGVLSLVVARLIGTTQIYQLAYALAGLLLVALVLGLIFSRGLRYERRLPLGERLVAGRASRVELAVENASRTRTSGVEVLDHLPDRRLVRVPPVEGAGTRTIREPVLFPKRGLYTLGPARLRTTDPFGLLRFVRKSEARIRVVVYPRTFDLSGFPARGRSIEAGASGAFARRGDEFSDLREYRHGDDRRHIHWKSVARTGELVVKEFAQEAPRRHAVFLDLHRPPNAYNAPETEVEDAVSAAGSALKHLAREGLPFRLLCSDRARNTTAFAEDEASYWRALALLATARADGDTVPGDFLAQKLREGRDGFGEGIVLVLRSLNKDVAGGVRELRALGVSVVVVALAAHTYHASGQGAALGSGGRAAAFAEDVRRLEDAGAVVRVVRRPGGVAALAEGPGRVRGSRG